MCYSGITLKFYSQPIPYGFSLFNFRGLQVRVSFEEKICQGDDPQDDNGQIRDNTDRPQEVDDSAFKEGSVPGRPEAHFVAGPGLDDPYREQSSHSQKE